MPRTERLARGFNPTRRACPHALVSRQSKGKDSLRKPLDARALVAGRLGERLPSDSPVSSDSSQPPLVEGLEVLGGHADEALVVMDDRVLAH